MFSVPNQHWSIFCVCVDHQAVSKLTAVQRNSRRECAVLVVHSAKLDKSSDIAVFAVRVQQLGIRSGSSNVVVVAEGSKCLISAKVYFANY